MGTARRWSRGPCAVRQELAAWGQQHGSLPLLRDTPGRMRQAPPRRWHGQSVIRRVAVEEADGRQDVAERRLRVVHSSPLAPQAADAYAAAQAQEAEPVAEPIQRVAARGFAGAADAEAAMAEDEGRGQGRRGRKPRPWRYQARRERGEASTQRQQRMPRGRPPPLAWPPDPVRYRLRSEREAHGPSAAPQDWTVRAATGGAESCTEAALLQVSQEWCLTSLRP